MFTVQILSNVVDVKNVTHSSSSQHKYVPLLCKGLHPEKEGLGLVHKNCFAGLCSFPGHLFLNRKTRGKFVI